jgi:adenylosuccinate synthase
MPAAVIVGAQWGDEGKGKVVDFYGDHADLVVRFNGGNNAGHTVVVGEKKFKLHLLPSGSVRGEAVIIANGTVIDPHALFAELEMFENEGIKPNLLISSRAHIILPYHLALDGAEESLKGKWAAGTTKRGIGPTYMDKVGRFGIRVCDLIHKETFEQKLDFLLKLKKSQMEQYGLDTSILDEIKPTYLEYANRIEPYVCDSSLEINKALDEGKNVMFEGAQGILLDIDHGVYPFGTSSNVVAGSACTGAGVGPTKITEVIGVVKAYLSRVGDGPVPTELTDETGNRIREAGHEYGTTTGRPRRCGWLDAVALKYASSVSGFTGIAITKLDVLGGFEKVKICTAYELNGKQITDHPALIADYECCKPVYEEMEGWPALSEDEWIKIAEKGYDALPEQMKAYISRISELCNAPVALVSVGAKRAATIMLKKPFEKQQ